MSSSGTSPALQPDPRQGVLQVVSGSDYLRRQEEAKHRWAVRLALPIIVLWLASLILSLGVLAAEITHRMGLAEVSLPFWANGVALVMILLDYALLPLLEHLLQGRDQYRQGLQGEGATVEALQQCLDSRWTLFRNVVLPGNRSDIDGVLVGSAGIYVLEIKSYSGRFKNQGDQWWWRRYQPGWRQLSDNPSHQATANAARLGEYLQQAIGQKAWVEPRVVWAGPGKLHIEGKPAVYIWFLDKMSVYAGELLRLPARRVDAMQRVLEALQGVVEAEKRGQDARAGQR